jgi:hypothetical protein
MRKFHSIAALRGDGLRPELQALFDRLAIDPHSELFIRSDGMTQSGPDPMQDSEVQIRPLGVKGGPAPDGVTTFPRTRFAPRTRT